MLRALLVITILISAGAAAAQYKWTDRNGRVQYGDTPPAGAKASTLRRPPLHSQSEAAEKKDDAKKGPASFAEKDADFRRRQQESAQEREKQAAAKRDAEAKRDNCARAHEMMRVLEGGRVARLDSKGEQYFLDEAQLAQEMARTRQAAQQWCN